VIEYNTPSRAGKLPKNIISRGITWDIKVGHPEMKARGEFVLQLDPLLCVEEIAGVIYNKYNNFLCKSCGAALIFDGQNGAGTPSLYCKACKHKMSIWNTFELNVFRYKKLISTFFTYVYGGSVDKSSALYGIGPGLFNEVRMCLPTITYTHKGALAIIEDNGTTYGVITIDMMYKGKKGIMLGVCGGVEFTTLGNETTGEGLSEFFDQVESKVQTDRYIFIMDMRRNVARRILDRFGEKAIIILQSHTLWGDVYVYFYKDGWYTLRLRTDTFTTVTKKHNEAELLAPGEIEVYKGLKGIDSKGNLNNLSVDRLKQIAKELITQVENADWESSGRVDIVMHAKLSRLNMILRALQRKKEDIAGYLTKIKTIIHKLSNKYKKRLNRTRKRKIINSWRGFTLLRAEIKKLSKTLLGEAPKAKELQQRKNRVRVNERPELIFRGKMDDPLVPESAKWCMGLLEKIFSGKEITTNPCEGRFGGIGLRIRHGRSIYLERALTNLHLQKQDVSKTQEWFLANYPIQDMGKRAIRGHRQQLKLGQKYKITYVDKMKNETTRIIEIIGRKGDCIIANCYLRGDVRTFNRSRITSIMPYNRIVN
jgi:hypothetical protein